MEFKVSENVMFLKWRELRKGERSYRAKIAEKKCFDQLLDAAPKSWSKYTTVNQIIFVCPFTCQSLNRQKLNYKTRISVFAQAKWTIF